MDLLLTHGYFLTADPDEQRIMRPHPPLGLLYLSSHLKSRGVDVGIFDGTFRQFDDFTAAAESEPHHDFNAAVKQEIGEATDHTDDSGQCEMKRLFIDPDAFPDLDRLAEMAPNKRENTAQEFV